jgi:hypothetical protein
MAKFEEQLSRMEFLMGYRTPVNEGVSRNIEYHTVGADGKVYGILREGSKYYIKTTEQGKQNLAESYDYINGFINRSENAYKSYNEASKQLELKLISINEAYGIHEDVATVDFNRGEKILANLTEEARKELNRVQQIMENSTKIGIVDNIGNHGDAESKGKSTGADTVKNNAPFDEKADVKLDRDSVATQSNPAKANKDYTEVDKNVETQLQSDKMVKGGSTIAKDFKDAHDDLDGDGVADKKPTGAKAVKMNESIEDENGDPLEDDEFSAFNDLDYDVVDGDEDLSADDGFNDIDPLAGTEPEPEVGSDIVGSDDEEDFDTMLEQFEDAVAKVSDPGECPDNTDAQGGEVLKNYNAKGSLSTQTCDRLNENTKKRINRIVESVCHEVLNKKKAPKKPVNESLEEAIVRIVKEEAHNLGVWGKHPRYGKQPMTVPANKEVLRGTANRDFNDDSAKGEEQYGKKIGSSAPFDKVVDMLTDSVMQTIKEQIAIKKK